MRRLSVLTAVALLAGTAFAGGVDVADPPDIRLMTGAAATGAFDMNDYFGTSNAGDPTFGGLAGANGVVDVPGSSTVGLTDHEISVTVGGDSGSATIARKVSSFMLAGGPGPVDNLTLVGQAPGSNLFLNCLRAGVAMDSAMNLTGGPAGGGGGTPGNGSPPAGGAAWLVTFGSVSSDNAPSGVLTRSVAVTAGPAADSLSAGGLTASIDADGKYTLASDASFTGPVLVTFTKKAGDDMDSATVLASAAIDAGNNYAVNAMEAGTTLLAASDLLGGNVDYQFGANVGASVPGIHDETVLQVNVAAGQVLQLFFPAVAVGEGSVSVSVGYVGSLGVSIAVMDNGVLTAGAQDLTYTLNLGPGEVDANTARRVGTSYDPPTNTIVPVIQIAGGAGGTVYFDNLWICAAESDITNSPGRMVAALDGFGAFTGDMSAGLDGAIKDINGQAGTIGFNDPAIVDANNFETAGAAASAQLSASGSALSNITVGANGVSGPTMVRLACAVQVVSSSGLGDSFGVVALVGGSANASGGATNFGTFASAGTLAGGDWKIVEAVAPIQSTALAGPLTVTAQSAIAAANLGAGDSFVVNIDDISVTSVDDAPEFFDADLLGG